MTGPSICSTWSANASEAQLTGKRQGPAIVVDPKTPVQMTDLDGFRLRPAFVTAIVKLILVFGRIEELRQCFGCDLLEIVTAVEE